MNIVLWLNELTDEQKEGVRKLWNRDLNAASPTGLSYGAFVEEKVTYDFLLKVAFVELWGMWIGIETDGYTHS